MVQRNAFYTVTISRELSLTRTGAIIESRSSSIVLKRNFATRTRRISQHNSALPLSPTSGHPSTCSGAHCVSRILATNAAYSELAEITAPLATNCTAETPSDVKPGSDARLARRLILLQYRKNSIVRGVFFKPVPLQGARSSASHYRH